VLPQRQKKRKRRKKQPGSYGELHTLLYYLPCHLETFARKGPQEREPRKKEPVRLPRREKHTGRLPICPSLPHSPVPSAKADRKRRRRRERKTMHRKKEERPASPPHTNQFKGRLPHRTSPPPLLTRRRVTWQAGRRTERETDRQIDRKTDLTQRQSLRAILSLGISPPQAQAHRIGERRGIRQTQRERRNAQSHMRTRNRVITTLRAGGYTSGAIVWLLAVVLGAAAVLLL